MRREAPPGKGVTTSARRRREHPRPPARHASDKHRAGVVPDPAKGDRRLEWADPLTEEEREALEAGWGFVE